MDEVTTKVLELRRAVEQYGSINAANSAWSREQAMCRAFQPSTLTQLIFAFAFKSESAVPIDNRETETWRAVSNCMVSDLYSKQKK